MADTMPGRWYNDLTTWVDYLKPGVTPGDLESFRATFINYSGLFLMNPKEIKLGFFIDSPTILFRKGE